MPQEIEGPDGTIYEFPDGMGDDEIASAMAREYGAPPKRTSQLQGFAKGAHRVAQRLAPLAQPFSPIAANSMRLASGGTLRCIGQRERQGVSSGRAGEFAGVSAG